MDRRLIYLLVLWQNFFAGAIAKAESCSMSSDGLRQLAGDRIIAISGYCHLSQRLAETCELGVDPLWAQRQVNLDLARDHVRSRNIDVSNLTVALIEPGEPSDRFIEQHLNVQNRSSAFRRTLIDSSPTRASGEARRHSEMVASLLFGRAGVGALAGANLIAVGNGSGVTNSLERRADSIIKACLAGATIINYSAGSDETRWEDELRRRVFPTLREHGCMIDQSASNSGPTPARNEQLVRDRPFWTMVESTELSGRRSQFSDEASSALGHYRLPGTNVFVSHSDQIQVGGLCASRGLTLTSGTSFAAPLMSSTRGLVVATLSTNPEWRSRLTGPQRVELVEAVLRATQSPHGAPNAYAAVLAADRIRARAQLVGLSTVDVRNEVEALRQNQCPRSQDDVPSCVEPRELAPDSSAAAETCRAYNSCTHRQRAHIALCGAGGPARQRLLFEQMLLSHRYADASRLIANIPPARRQEFVDSIARHINTTDVSMDLVGLHGLVMAIDPSLRSALRTRIQRRIEAANRSHKDVLGNLIRVLDL